MSADRMPALFLGHGNPMHAISDDPFTRSLARLAADLPRPKAVLVVSAHWLTAATHVLASERPKTIHDFGGFPQALYDVEYPAPGSPQTAADVCDLVPGVTPVDAWGLDHASWAVLRHMWPDADVPVLELSLDMTAAPQRHWDIGRALAPLRDRGVLIVGSGNIVHSFAGISWEPDAAPRPWAIEFDERIADALLRRDAAALVDYDSSGVAADLSVPTTDHYLPLLYAAAASDENDRVSFPYEGIEMSSMSMRCVRFG